MEDSTAGKGELNLEVIGGWRGIFFLFIFIFFIYLY